MFLYHSELMHRGCACGLMVALLCALVVPVAAREKDATDYGVGLVNNIPLPEKEVAQVVSEVAQNGIIRGTKEYEKDEYIKGAAAADSCKLFAPWRDGGKIFYKVRKDALDPRNFKESNDIGTLAVRYVVQPQGDNNTIVRIDAVFVEDFRRVVHPSNGSVESNEYKIIQDHLDAIELMKKQAADAEEQRKERLAKKDFGNSSEVRELTASSDLPARTEPSAASAAGQEATLAVAAQPGESLEEHVASLRRELERRVRAPGAPLKAAPFHSASTLKTLSSGTEVLIVITTPYWLGVETRDGQHGWILREQLDLLP